MGQKGYSNRRSETGKIEKRKLRRKEPSMKQRYPDLAARIEALSNAFGPSGLENEPAALIAEEAQAAGDNIVLQDSLHSVYVRQKGSHPQIMLDAHIDEVGFMVHAIHENGTFSLLPLGGWTAQNLPGTVLQVRTEKGTDVPAIIASRPPHYTRDLPSVPPADFSTLAADCGTCSKAETEALGIVPGCFIVPWTRAVTDPKRQMVMGKAFDDRLGAAVCLETFLQAEKEGLGSHLMALFSAQEEVGERGAAAAAEYLKDIRLCIAFEGCPADDTFAPADEIQSAVKQGPMIRAFDKSMVTHPAFLQLAKDCAAENGLPLQIAVRKGGGTNGGIYHQHNIPTIVIGIPVRYAHSPVGWCSLTDARNGVSLALAILEELEALSVKKNLSQAEQEIFDLLQGKNDPARFFQER